MWNKFSEDKLIENLSKFWESKINKNVIVPNGDDTLALLTESDKLYLLTVDTSLENVHFTKRLLSFREIGYRAVAGALSDIAAMGGYPITILVDIEIPVKKYRNVEEIYYGIDELAKKYDFSIGGGNIVKGDRWRITTTVLGAVEKEKVLTRKLFKPGDYIYITGDIGRVWFFFNLQHKKKKDIEIYNILREKFAHPVPRIQEMRYLVSTYKLGGAIDISDGLGIDLWRVAKASGVKIIIDLTRLPYIKELEIFKSNLVDFLKALCASGEEYEVCFSSPELINDPGVTRIGYVETGTPDVIGKIENRLIKVKNLGYDHLR
ncbi:MAG: thiamine-phosphate kinase [candidate division WOR-3 bacterium]